MDERRDDGGLAFPNNWPDSKQQGMIIRGGHSGGMTLRDYFAAHALGMLGGFLASGRFSCSDNFEQDAKALVLAAYAFADAMLKERSRQ